MASTSQLRKALDSARKRVGKIKEKSEEAIKTTVEAGEVGLSAFGFGYGRGRLGTDGRWQMAGVDVDLMAALGLHVVGFVVDKEYASHAHAFGNGALACYATNLGMRLGSEAKQKQPATAGMRRPQFPMPSARAPQYAPRDQSAFTADLL